MCRAEWLGVSKWTAETDRRKTPRQKEKRGRTERAGAAAAGAVRGGHTRLVQHGLSVLNIVRHFLKEQKREEKAALRGRPLQPEQTQRLRRFKYWLGKRDPYLANLWSFRGRIAPDANVRKFEFPKPAHWPRPMPPIGK